jgi:hypothetical protein
MLVVEGSILFVRSDALVVQRMGSGLRSRLCWFESSLERQGFWWLARECRCPVFG